MNVHCTKQHIHLILNDPGIQIYCYNVWYLTYLSWKKYFGNLKFKVPGIFEACLRSLRQDTLDKTMQYQ